MINANLKPEDLIKKVEELSGGHLNQPDDLKLIIESAIGQNEIPLLEELSFHAKFLTGLLRVIQRRDSTIDEEYFQKAAGEFQNSVENIRAVFEKLLSGSTEFIRSVLTEKYLRNSQGSLANLNSLCSDLSYLKLYFNDQKIIKGKGI